MTTVPRRWSLPEERDRLTRKQISALFIRQDGRCPNCQQKLEMKGGLPVFVDEHVEPLWRRGTNELKNRELWCKPCTVPKTSGEATQRAKAYAVRDKMIGAKVSKTKAKGLGFGGRNPHMKKMMDGRVIDRRTGLPWGQSEEEE